MADLGGFIVDSETAGHRHKQAKKPKHRARRRVPDPGDDSETTFDEENLDEDSDECESSSSNAGRRSDVSRSRSCWWSSNGEDSGSSGISEDTNSDYMGNAWEEEDMDWLPPGQRRQQMEARRARLMAARQKRGRRGRRKRRHCDDEFGADEEQLDPEEDVDADDRSQTYCPLDLDSFNGLNLPPEAFKASTQSHPPIYEDHLDGAWGDISHGPKPGERGFNAFVAERMRASGIGAPVETRDCESCPALQPQQEVVAFLLHRTSPIKHLLVDHPTGSGKTREMIRILDGFFDDPRPKVPIFPKQPVCRNFYMELLRWPSRLRDYYCCICPGGAFLASGGAWRERRKQFWDLKALPEAEVRELVRSCRQVLEMRGAFFEGQLRPQCRAQFEARHPGEPFPAAPLRALGYASAGGFNIRLDHHGRPLSAFFKVAHRRAFANVYDAKIVLMDEAHNLVRTETQYSTQLAALRDHLQTAEGTVLAGFTGTPILEEPGEGRLLLEIIKGKEKGATDEGFLSSLAVKPRPLFPRCFPAGVPDVALTRAVLKRLCGKVVLHGDALLAYALKAYAPDVPEKRARAYCNMCAYAGSYHDGANGCKSAMLRHPERRAPKLQAIAEAVVRHRQKALVLVARGSGYRAMLDIMRQAAAAAKPPFGVASMDELAEFNAASNLEGQQLLCLVADTAQCGEGVSFFAVRRLHLADVPETPTAFVQQCGRANRMFGHSRLAPEAQTVTVRLHIAVLPSWAREALGAWILRAYSRRTASGTEVEQQCQHALKKLRSGGVKTLDALKVRVDAFGVSKAKRHRLRAGQSAERRDGKLRALQLEVEEVAEFLESLDLKAEASAVRGRGSEDHCEKASSGSRRRHAHPLLRAIQALYHVQAAEISRGLRMETLDELALQRLARSSEACSRALGVLRSHAVDRDILAHLAQSQQGEEEEPDDSGYEVIDFLHPAKAPPSKSKGNSAHQRSRQKADSSKQQPPASKKRAEASSAVLTDVRQPASLQRPSLKQLESSRDPPASGPAPSELGQRRLRLTSKQPPGGNFRSQLASSTDVSARGAASSSSSAVCATELQARVAASGRGTHGEGTALQPFRKRSRTAASVPTVETEGLQIVPYDASPQICKDNFVGMSVSSLKELLARVRPDVDMRTVKGKKHLCDLLRPYL